MKEIRIGLLGLGNIGTGTYKALEMNREKIEKLVGGKVSITRILEKDIDRERDITVSREQFVDSIEAITEDPDIDIVIELLGGVEPASTFIEKALLAGKHVVTANKAAVAASWERLHAAAAKTGVQFRFEASVGGGIPIIRTLNSCLTAEKIEAIVGILNGTTNYMLSKMEKEGAEYADVLTIYFTR